MTASSTFMTEISARGQLGVLLGDEADLLAYFGCSWSGQRKQMPVAKNPQSRKCKPTRRNLTHDQLTEQFWLKVDKNGPVVRHELGCCWIYTAEKDRNGYGIVWDGSQQVYAHVFSYWLAYGPIADGCEVRYLCDNRHCVNPSHLFAGTPNRRGGRGRLSNFEVGEIRRLYATGEHTYQSLAERFGLRSHDAITKVIQGTGRTLLGGAKCSSQLLSET